MPRYWNSFANAYRESATVLGYPYIPAKEGKEGAEGTTELAARTADAILADVGTDGVAAQAALDAELARDKPRTSLTAKLQKIVEAAADE